MDVSSKTHALWNWSKGYTEWIYYYDNLQREKMDGCLFFIFLWGRIIQ